MYAQAQTVYSTMQRPRGLICGVCARLGERSGVPVIVIRVAAVILLLAHALATFIVYLMAAAWMRRPAKRHGAIFARRAVRRLQVEVGGRARRRRRFGTRAVW